jgi:hypothetical protein
MKGLGLSGFFGKLSDWITNPKHITAIAILCIAVIILKGFLTGELSL